MAIKLIIATGANYEIGQNGKLPWGYIKEDMEYFKEKTKGSIVVMGRKTYESLPFDDGLPNRMNYVLTSNPEKFNDKQSCGVRSTYDLNKYCLFTTPVDVWVIGGTTVYRDMLKYVDEIHWTLVEGVFPDADTHFDMEFLHNDLWDFQGWSWLVEDMVSVSVWKRKKNN